MSLDPGYLLYGVYGTLFLAALFLVHGLAALRAARRQNAERRRRRMGQGAELGGDRDAPGPLRRARRRPGRQGDPLTPTRRALAARLDRAGLTLGPGRFLSLVLGLAVLAALFLPALLLSSGLASDWIGPALGMSAAVGLAAGIGLPLAYLRQRRIGRQRRFASQLPEALDVMARGLRAGHPVSTAMLRVQSDLPEPIASEFGRAIDEMTYGLSLREALAHLAARVDLADLRFVVASVGLQHETGGNLAEVLQSIAELMRSRARLIQKVRAYSAEARLSARILAVMPLVFVALVLAANPEVYSDAARDPLVFPVLLGAGALQVIGILVMRHMAGFRV